MTAAAPRFDPRPPRPGSRFVSSAIWSRAGDGDPGALQELAVLEGAAGLLEGAREGGSVGRTALAALPYTPDGEVVLGEVCGWARAAAPRDAALVLAAVHGVLGHPPLGNERLDADGTASCLLALIATAARTDLEPGARDLAVSALAMAKAGAPRPAQMGLSSAP